MKNILIYSSLLLLLGACGTDKKNTDTNNTTNEQEQVEDRPVRADDFPDPSINNKNTEATSSTPTTGNNCTPSTLEVYLDDPDDSGTNIRQSPGGAVVTQLVKADEESEFFITITEAQKGWFKIKSPVGGMEEDVEIPNGEGWIHGSVIGIDTRNYGGETLELLDKPVNGSVVGTIKEEAYGLKLKDICGRWVQVEYKGTIGWIDSNWLCGNPLTTCS